MKEKELQKGKHPIKCNKCGKEYAEMMHFGGENLLTECAHCEGIENTCPECYYFPEIKTNNWTRETPIFGDSEDFTPPLETNDTWEEEFQNEFEDLLSFIREKYPLRNRDRHLILHITSLLTRTRHQLAEEIEKAKHPEVKGGTEEMPWTEFPTARPAHESNEVFMQFSFNAGLQTAKEIVLGDKQKDI